MYSMDGPRRSQLLVYDARRKDGSIFRVEVAAAVVHFRATDALQDILRDVTERERLKTRLRQTRRLESTGRLAGGIAHGDDPILLPRPPGG